MVRDGYIYGLSLLAVAAVLKWVTGELGVEHCAGPAGGVFSLVFPRSSTAQFPPATGLIVSPGDGLVTETASITTPEGVAPADQHLPQCF